jgi:hypothetical protein
MAEELRTKRRIYFAAAAFLLMWTSVDILFPQISLEDADVPALFTATGAAPPVERISQESGSKPSGAPIHPDGCFCCCPHVLPSFFAHITH